MSEQSNFRVTIFVGSTNPVKINATILAASETYPEVSVQGFSVPSGVSEQPMTDDETKQGAMNRAKAALALGLSNEPETKSNGQIEPIYLGLGLEGGVFLQNNELWSTVWGIVATQDEEFFYANGGRSPVPQIIADLMLQGKEMGPVMDELLGESDIRHKQGMLGVITNNFVDRTEEYASIAKFALGRWYGRNWAHKLGKNSN